MSIQKVRYSPEKSVPWDRDCSYANHYAIHTSLPDYQKKKNNKKPLARARERRVSEDAGIIDKDDSRPSENSWNISQHYPSTYEDFRILSEGLQIFSIVYLGLQNGLAYIITQFFSCIFTKSYRKFSNEITIIIISIFQNLQMALFVT